MFKRILWMDNDKVFLVPHILRLETEGYTVEQALTLTAGLEALKSNDYDLLILDVMMPREDSKLFPEKDTDSGKKGGLVLYKKCKEMLGRRGVIVLVFTIREDAAIRDEFLAAGLPAENFMTKSEGADTADFLAKVDELLGEKPAQ